MIQIKRFDKFHSLNNNTKQIAVQYLHRYLFLHLEMKIKHCFAIFFIIAFWETIFSQVLCLEKCFNVVPFISSTIPIEIEKKWQSEVDIHGTSIPLIYDINNDGRPEIIVPKFLNDGNFNFSNEISIIDSKNGNLIYTIPTPYFHNNVSSAILIFDINFDCKPEILISCSGNDLNSSEFKNRIICIDLNGNIIWISDDVVTANGLYDPLQYNYGSISIADFNLDGIPEVYIYNEIFNAQTGIKLIQGNDYGKGIGKVGGLGVFGTSVAANLDNDQELELAAGYTVYKVNIVNKNGRSGNSMTPINLNINNHFVDGFTSVADLDLDGKLDVVVASRGKFDLNENVDIGLYCYTIEDGQAILLGNIGKYKPSITGWACGPVTIVYNPHIDKIEILSVLFASNNDEAIISLSLDNSKLLKLNWEINIQEKSSLTAISAFDIDGDGVNEIAHRDEQFLRILKLTNNIPNEILKIPCVGRTTNEFPVIADIDGTGQAKICISCHKKFVDYQSKLFVFGAPEGQRWAPARNIWHQYAYNPLFINDDGTVPQFQENHATYKNGKYNNFMVQESLIDENGNVPVPAASLHGEMYCTEYHVDNEELRVYFNILNKENASLAAAINTPVSFYDGNPESGGVLLTRYYTTQVIDAGENVSSLSVTLPADITGPIWMVINTDKINPVLSDSSQYFIPECDYTDNVFVLYDLPVIDKITAEICEGDVYDFMGQMVNATGQYIIEAQNQNGCDSAIYILNLTTTNVKTSEEDITQCDTYTWNATTYTQSGTYTYQTTSSNGCDSIATLHLTIHPSSESEANINACDTYVWNGNTYTDSGTYTYQTLNAVGCDSTTTLHLTIYPSYADTTFVTTCDSYLWNGNTYSTDGIYSFQAQSANGCDSISTLVLNIQNTIETEENITACDQYDWNGNTYSQSGEYTYQTTSSSGCDSIVTLFLDVFPSVTTQENISACDSLIWQNQILTTSGMYTHQEMTIQGCDSTKQLFLTILPSTTSQAQIQACESYDWNGQTYTSSGLYTYQTNNHVGCDSTAYLELIIHPKVEKNINVSTCYPYEWNGETYTQSGMYRITQPNQYGCDSTTNLQLTIHPTYQNALSLSACTEVEFQNNTYTTSGVYEVMLQSVFGCDSIINLTVNINAQSFEESQSACDSFYWPRSQEQYHENGIYEAVFMNAQGCDSTYQLTLEILPSYRQTEAREVCETYTWPSNQQTYTQSGIYTIQTQTQRGCDSIQTLDLTIYEGFRKRDTIIADSSYTWPVNGITYDTPGEYEARYLNGEGCDSIHYLVLRIESTYTIQFPNIITGGTNANPFKGFSNHDNVVIKELTIYDRMASRVYHVENTRVNDPNYGWNGTFRGMDVLPGVYVWMVELILPDGSIKQMTGDVTVIR